MFITGKKEFFDTRYQMAKFMSLLAGIIFSTIAIGLWLARLMERETGANVPLTVFLTAIAIAAWFVLLVVVLIERSHNNKGPS
jgi:hypothetical protein